MNSCRYCKYASWKRNANGRRHPGGEGQCTYEVKLPTLPLARRWVGGGAPELSYGWLQWKTPREKCPTFQPLDQQQHSQPENQK